MDVQISQFSKHVGEKVTVKGWVYNVRSSGSIAFLQIRDGSSFTQAVVVKDQVSEKAWEQTTQITIESSLIIMGEVSRHPKKEGVFELQATELSIVQIGRAHV